MKQSVAPSFLWYPMYVLKNVWFVVSFTNAECFKGKKMTKNIFFLNIAGPGRERVKVWSVQLQNCVAVS